MGGTKHDQGKPPLALIPSDSLMEVGRAFGFGASKYDEYNWCEGIDYNRLTSAALRHIVQFNGGEDKDPESGLSHLSHACCNLLMLLHFELTGKPGLDNRYKGDNDEGNKN